MDWRVEGPCLSPLIQLTLSGYFRSLEKTEEWRCLFSWNTAFKSGRAFSREQFLRAKPHSFCEKTISKGPMIKCELKKEKNCTYNVSLIDSNPPLIC